MTFKIRYFTLRTQGLRVARFHALAGTRITGNHVHVSSKMGILLSISLDTLVGTLKRTIPNSTDTVGQGNMEMLKELFRQPPERPS